MQHGAPHTARIVVLVLTAGLFINNPLLGLFNSPALVLGIPALYLYVFGVWAGLIFLIRAVMTTRPRSQGRNAGSSTRNR